MILQQADYSGSRSLLCFWEKDPGHIYKIEIIMVYLKLITKTERGTCSYRNYSASSLCEMGSFQTKSVIEKRGFHQSQQTNIIPVIRLIPDVQNWWGAKHRLMHRVCAAFEKVWEFWLQSQTTFFSTSYKFTRTIKINFPGLLNQEAR